MSNLGSPHSPPIVTQRSNLVRDVRSRRDRRSISARLYKCIRSKFANDARRDFIAAQSRSGFWLRREPRRDCAITARPATRARCLANASGVSSRPGFICRRRKDRAGRNPDRRLPCKNARDYATVETVTTLTDTTVLRATRIHIHTRAI